MGGVTHISATVSGYFSKHVSYGSCMKIPWFHKHQQTVTERKSSSRCQRGRFQNIQKLYFASILLGRTCIQGVYYSSRMHRWNVDMTVFVYKKTPQGTFTVRLSDECSEVIF